MESHKYWGEFENKSSPTEPDVSAEIEKAMSKYCLSEFETEENLGEGLSELVELPPGNPLIDYAITLHKYQNNMVELLRVTELAIESDLIPPDDAPPIPKKPIIQKTHFKQFLNYYPKEYTEFTEGVEQEYPELCESLAKQILTKNVATLFAHIGFETTHNSVLLFMTEIVEEFLKKLCIRLKKAREEEKKFSNGGFSSFSEKVFIEFGFGGMKGIHDYYENRVVRYVDVLYQRCEDLNKQYDKLLHSNQETKE